MSENTKIEWCDHSWSPWRGCTKVSPGCAHCYAETLSKRNPAVLGQWGKGKPRVLAKNWNDPEKWDRNVLGDLVIEPGKPDQWTPYRRPTVFPSLCDWLDEEVPIAWLARFLALIHATPNLTWLLLSKRPENWAQRLAEVVKFKTDGTSKDGQFWQWLVEWFGGQPPSNVWPGTSCENQEWADKRILALLKIPATGRFLSVEPMLGPVDLTEYLGETWECKECYDGTFQGGRATIGPKVQICGNCAGDKGDDGALVRYGRGIEWVIYGGESGPGARPCNVDWIRDGVRQCKAAGVSPFVKQLGARPVEDIHDDQGRYLGFKRPDGITHPKGGDPSEWPADLRVREFPEGLR